MGALKNFKTSHDNLFRVHGNANDYDIGDETAISFFWAILSNGIYFRTMPNYWRNLNFIPQDKAIRVNDTNGNDNQYHNN